MVSKFVIGELVGPKTTLDQVISGREGRGTLG
jgi:hypothetical protein